jgi:hypothetical protein
MKSQLNSYFFAEKWEGLGFVLVGLGAIVLAALLWKGAYRGMGLPLILIAFIQIAVGGSVFVRSDAQLASLHAQLDIAPTDFVTKEVPRMEKVMSNFRIYKAVELLVFVLGVALTFAMSRNNFAYSAGIGCIAQASFMLVLDLFAEHRGAEYLAALRALSSSG